MTLEEAKREIKRIYEEKHEAFLRTSMSLFDAEANGIKEAIKIVDKIDAEPVGKSDRLTLTGLACRFRELYKFDYFVVGPSCLGNPTAKMWISEKKPIFTRHGWGYYNKYDDYNYLNVEMYHLTKEVDLSEYMDDKGNIDYSKCIVDLSEYKED